MELDVIARQSVKQRSVLANHKIENVEKSVNAANNVKST